MKFHLFVEYLSNIFASYFDFIFMTTDIFYDLKECVSLLRNRHQQTWL